MANIQVYTHDLVLNLCSCVTNLKVISKSFFDDKVANGKSMTNIMTMAAPQNAQITVKVNGVDEEILVKELTDWQTEAHKSKEDFDNFPDKFELLKVFEII